MDVRWKHPFTCIVAGPTGCGKSTFVTRMLHHAATMIEPPPERITWNTSVLYLVQNLFPKNKESRTISLNSQYMVVFKNPRDASQMSHLARQMYPGHARFMQQAFKDATSVPYGYLLVDLKHDTPEDMRLRTAIFPDDGVQYVYLPKV